MGDWEILAESVFAGHSQNPLMTWCLRKTSASNPEDPEAVFNEDNSNIIKYNNNNNSLLKSYKNLIKTTHKTSVKYS